MKTVAYSPAAQRALLKHRAEAPRIIAKVKAYAAKPEAFAKVTTLVGQAGVKRLRIGSFRVLFSEDATTILVTEIGPRGRIYR